MSSGKSPNGAPTGASANCAYPTAAPIAKIESLRTQLEAGLDRQGLQKALPPGAARNALDCAFWDLEAKLSGRPAYELAKASRRRRPLAVPA